MVAPYEFIALPNDIIYIRWYRFPKKPEDAQFVNDIQKALDEADHKVYFISDLRKGYVTDVRLVHKLGEQTTHKNWGGGTAFGGNPVTYVFLSMFVRAADATATTGTLPSAHEALEYLEGVKPGITNGIDWEELFNFFVKEKPPAEPPPTELYPTELPSTQLPSTQLSAPEAPPTQSVTTQPTPTETPATQSPPTQSVTTQSSTTQPPPSPAE